MSIEENLYREEMSLAPISKRAVAAFIDELLLSFLLILSLGNSFTNAQDIEQIINTINQFLLEFVAIKIVYQAFFTMQYGATLGKMAMKIRVIEQHSMQKPNVLLSLNRATIRIFSEMLFYLGFLWGMLDPNRQTWHDKSAKTLVIND